MRRASTKKKGRGRVIKSTGSEVGRRAFLLKRPTMSVPALRVEVLGDEIIVMLPATSYGVTTLSQAIHRTLSDMANS
jgi:hypothetical protein